MPKNNKFPTKAYFFSGEKGKSGRFAARFSLWHHLKIDKQPVIIGDVCCFNIWTVDSKNPPEFPKPIAEKRVIWVITKKVFFDLAKNMIFLQFLQTGNKYQFHPINTGNLIIAHFPFRSKTGQKPPPKKYRVKSTVDYRFGNFSDRMEAELNEKVKMQN